MLTLGKILNFNSFLDEEILKKNIDMIDHSKLRFKTRFNTNWIDDTVEPAKEINYLSMYRNEDVNFIPFITSDGNKQNRNKEGDIQLNFINIAPNRWLFVKTILVIKPRKKQGTHFDGKTSFDYAETKYLDWFKDYEGRLIVEHANLRQKFFYVKPEYVNDIKVHSYSDTHFLDDVEAFPGYENFNQTYENLKRKIEHPSWENALANVFGVYLLLDTNTGKQYVGSATGENGLFGRWSTYLDKGYYLESGKDYPNKLLRQLVKKEGIEYIQKYFEYTILDYFPKNDTGKERALKCESYWKKVLKSKEFGYNCN